MVSLAAPSPHSVAASSTVMLCVRPPCPSMRLIASHTSRMEFSPFSVLYHAPTRLLAFQHVHTHNDIAVHTGPAVLARANVLRHAEFFCQLDQPRHLDALRIETVSSPVDQARRNHDRAYAVACRIPHHLVDFHARRSLRRRCEPCLLIEHILD